MVLGMDKEIAPFRQIFRELNDTNGLAKHASRNVLTMKMQGTQKASDSMEVKRRKEKTIDTLYARGSMMLIPGQAQIPGLGNVNQVHHLRQVDKRGKQIHVQHT